MGEIARVQDDCASFTLNQSTNPHFPLMKTRFLFSLPLVLAMALTAQAAVTVVDFESYTLGSNLHGQDLWKGWDNNPAVGAVISNDFAAGGTQSVKVQEPCDQVRTFSSVSGGTWNVSIMQYIPSTSTGSSYFILLNDYNDGGATNFSVQVQCDMASGKVISDLGGSAQLDMVKNAWVELRFAVNFTSNTVTEYYNNQVLSTHPWQDGSGLNQLAALDMYADDFLAAFSGPVYYDNLSVVPEPTTAMAVALGGLVFLRRRRRIS